jgi:hypothetical protein
VNKLPDLPNVDNHPDMPTDAPKEQTVTVLVPVSVATLMKYLWGKFDPAKIPNDKLARTAAYACAANYMLRHNMEPLGATWGNKHVLPQVGTVDIKEAYLDELARRLPHVTVFVDIKKPKK